MTSWALIGAGQAELGWGTRSEPGLPNTLRGGASCQWPWGAMGALLLSLCTDAWKDVNFLRNRESEEVGKEEGSFGF